MENIYGCIVNTIVKKLIKDCIIDEEKMEVYQFGVEVTLLKLTHFVCYFTISILIDKLLQFLVIYVVFYLFRCNTGGFHAKTRTGCLIFSCLSIFLTLQISDINMNLWVMHILMIVALMALLCIAPIEHKNRNLDCKEKNYFRKRLIIDIILFLTVYTALVYMGFIQIAWLFAIGVLYVTVLTLLGKIQCG